MEKLVYGMGEVVKLGDHVGCLEPKKSHGKLVVIRINKDTKTITVGGPNAHSWLANPVDLYLIRRKRLRDKLDNEDYRLLHTD